jgi:DNA replication and repair protein RecF
MRLEKLTIVNFRNYDRVEVKFTAPISLIFGLNAQGKTNLIESIYLLCLGRSFRTSVSEEFLKSGSGRLTLEGEFELDNKIKKAVVVQYIKGGKKEISINHKRLKSHAEIFGHFPVVVMSPEDYRISTGGPQERRRFIDILLSQLSMSYLANLQEYHRVLKQRNKILQAIKTGAHYEESAVEPWTEKLIELGCQITHDRKRGVEALGQELAVIYRAVTDSKECLSVDLESSIIYDSTALADNFCAALNRLKSKERLLGMTLAGPHRDDLVFRNNGLDVRRFGSRGEHKSLLIALKLAEFKFLKQKTAETPVFLLDDYYSELDDWREEHVFSMLCGLGQIFLTSPKETWLNERAAGLASSAISKFYIENGIIAQRE